MFADHKFNHPARAKKRQRYGVAWLELLLLLACLALLLEVFPLLWIALLWAMDVRNWTRGVWMCLNVGIVLALIGIRFGPELYDEWRNRPGRGSAKRESDDKRLTLKEERALYERMAEARKRQVV